MRQLKELTLSDFMEKSIIRTGNKAELVFDYANNRPIRLIGFSTESSNSDFEVREQAFLYFLNLIDTSEQLKE